MHVKLDTFNEMVKALTTLSGESPDVVEQAVIRCIKRDDAHVFEYQERYYVDFYALKSHIENVKGGR